MEDLSKRMEEIFNDQQQLDLFKVYSKRRMCSEHVDFWLDCEKFKGIEDDVVLKLRARELFDNYVNENSPQQLNVDAPIVRAVRAGLDNPTTELFNDAQAYITNLMVTSVVPGFLDTKEYKAFLEGAAQKKVGIQIKDGWKHKGADSQLAKRMQREAEKLENEKELGGIEHLQVQEQNERLEKHCRMLENDQMDAKRRIQTLEKQYQELLKDKDKLRQRQTDLRKHLEQTKTILTNASSLLNIIPEDPFE
mmetsp:Transcript_18359/g.70939  ORF Transcript_18359/g.70939 Transcript_18359/m.70939 type:complete len:250 (+) Transcript_18359:161-910(+)